MDPALKDSELQERRHRRDTLICMCSGRQEERGTGSSQLEQFCGFAKTASNCDCEGTAEQLWGMLWNSMSRSEGFVKRSDERWDRKESLDCIKDRHKSQLCSVGSREQLEISFRIWHDENYLLEACPRSTVGSRPGAGSREQGYRVRSDDSQDDVRILQRNPWWRKRNAYEDTESRARWKDNWYKTCQEAWRNWV